jgi:hypothetical protein
MKGKTKHGYTQVLQTGNKHSVLKRLQRLQILTKRISLATLGGYHSDPLERYTPQERLVEIEAARNRALGQAYVNMIPPK